MGLPFGPIVVSSICYYLLGAASNLMNGPLQACFLVIVYVRTVLFVYMVLFFFRKDFFFRSRFFLKDENKTNTLKTRSSNKI